MRIALLAAEPSGDRVAGQLATELKRLAPNVELYGTGGKWLRDAGVELYCDASQWGVIGVAAALRLLPQMIAARNRLFAALRRNPPDLLIPVDAGAFHLGFGKIQGLCPWARQNLPQTKVLYYFPPGSWRKTLRYTPLAGLTDAIASPFPWNAAELTRLGANATFVGHPLLDLVKPSQTLEAFSQKYGLDTDKPIVGLLPGSRAQELEVMLPLQLTAALQIAQRLPGVQFLIGLAPGVNRSEVEAALRTATAQPPSRRPRETQIKGKGEAFSLAGVPIEGSAEQLAQRQQRWIEHAHSLDTSKPVVPPFAIVEDATYDVLAASDALICKSGTTTLEAAVLGKPMVIVYRLAAINKVQYRLAKKAMPRFVGMPNLIADKEICRELIQDDATPEAISAEILGLLLDPDRMARMRRDLRSVREVLGEPGGAERTARMALELIGYRTRESA